MAENPNWIKQAAAIPVNDGRICIVKSSSGKRWVVPKGCLEPGKSTQQIALLEAWEEAGLEGELEPDPVGSYLYKKIEQTYHVTVYLMQVTEVAKDYPESKMRERDWVSPTQALKRINDVGLLEVLRRVVKNERLMQRA
jgi:8-oxo-dGTP pyrophosphatase MutT (NUDIX family)